MAYSDLAALLAMVAAGVGDAVGPAMLRAVTTHRHPDHLGALAELVRRTGVRHTPGGIALALANAGQTHLLVGDPLFPGGVGRTTSPPDFSQLMNDVEQRLFAAYPDGAVVHPGHGLPTTLGTERPHLGEWRARGW